MEIGATWANLGIELVRLAREDLWRFSVFVGFIAIAGGVALAIMVLVLKVIVIGPLDRLRGEYEETSRRGREPREPRLPL